MSTYLVKGLLGAYILLALVYLWEGDRWRALYWTGAAMITVAVWRM